MTCMFDNRYNIIIPRTAVHVLEIDSVCLTCTVCFVLHEQQSVTSIHSNSGIVDCLVVLSACSYVN